MKTPQETQKAKNTEKNLHTREYQIHIHRGMNTRMHNNKERETSIHLNHNSKEHTENNIAVNKSNIAMYKNTSQQLNNQTKCVVPPNCQ